MPNFAESTQPDAHLGRGWCFPMRISIQGDLQLSAGRTNIEESIQIILRTRIGERVYRPDFGCRLSELTFMPMSTETLLLVRLHVQEALEKWEPRIILDQIATEPDPLRGRVDIIIQYHPKDNPVRRSIVYPFYLMSPE